MNFFVKEIYQTIPRNEFPIHSSLLYYISEKNYLLRAEIINHTVILLQMKKSLPISNVVIQLCESLSEIMIQKMLPTKISSISTLIYLLTYIPVL